MSKHRPGPWILSESSVLRYGETKETQICEIFCNRNNKVIAEIPDYCFHPEDVDQDRADARLIAAAPELLEALKACVSQIRALCSPDDVPEQAIASIAKAAGQ